MAADYYLKIDGIKGESTDDKHKEEIDIESFNWSEKQEKATTGASHGAGKVRFEDAVFTSKLGKHSPAVSIACATGQHIKEAVIYCRRAGGKQEEYYNIKFTDIFVSSYEVTGLGSADSVPVDKYALNFAKIEFEYKAQGIKGEMGTPNKAGYDIKANKKI